MIPGGFILETLQVKFQTVYVVAETVLGILSIIGGYFLLFSKSLEIKKLKELRKTENSRILNSRK